MFRVEEGSFTLMQYPSINGFVKTNFPMVSDLFLLNCYKYRDCLNPSCFSFKHLCWCIFIKMFHIPPCTFQMAFIKGLWEDFPLTSFLASSEQLIKNTSTEMHNVDPLTSVNHCAKKGATVLGNWLLQPFFHGSLCSYCDSAELLRHQLVCAF